MRSRLRPFLPSRLKREMETICGPIDRTVTLKTEGNKHGPITRLVSPGDIGQLIKPFIFLDHFSMPSGPGGFKGFGWHPHSGIATVTVLLEGSIWYEETTSKGEIEAGGVEYRRTRPRPTAAEREEYLHDFHDIHQPKRQS